MLDFVRRRKLRRIAVFRPDRFLPQEVYSKCDFCDSQVVDMLSSAMLDALSLATLFAHGPKSNVTDAQVIPLRCKLIDSLHIGGNCNNDTHSKDYDPRVDIDKVKDRLCKFAEECVGKKPAGPLMHLLNNAGDVDRNFISALPGRRKALMSKYFNDEERSNLARLLVKDVDRHSYKLHCRNDHCASVTNGSGSFDNDDDDGEEEEAKEKVDHHPRRVCNCEFRLVPCPNENCISTFSLKHATGHDDVCGHRLLPCPGGCGIEIPRNRVHVHVRDECSLREAECPLKDVGCTAIVRARDVPRHLTDHADKHFILMANRMMEYQDVMKDLNCRVRLLEEKNGQLERELKRTTAQLQSKNEAKAVANDVKKLTRRIGTLEGTFRTEFKKVENDRRNHQK